MAVDLLLLLKPAAHESYRLSKSYSCPLAQPIAHCVRVDFTQFSASCNLFSRIKLNMFDMREKVIRGTKFSKIHPHTMSYRLSQQARATFAQLTALVCGRLYAHAYVDPFVLLCD